MMTYVLINPNFVLETLCQFWKVPHFYSLFDIIYFVFTLTLHNDDKYLQQLFAYHTYVSFTDLFNLHHR